MKKLFILSLLLFFPLLASAQTFERNLYFGMQKDTDVTKLQEFLTEEGVYTGPITGNFFSLTLKAVKDFQARESVVPAAGYFGPLTRVKANDILDTQIGASDEQAIAETGESSTQPVAPKNLNDVNQSLQDQITLLTSQIALLQQQLVSQQATQQSMEELKSQVETQTQAIQSQSTIIESQNQTIQQIQQQTVPPPPHATYVPPATPDPVITKFVGTYETGFAWTSENTSKCSLATQTVGFYLGQKSHLDPASGKWIVTTFYPSNGICSQGLSGWKTYFGSKDREITLECYGENEKSDKIATSTITIYKLQP
jgi:peptidoglycan hydrolase-like protein with peptidoglycan-binding domain